MNHTDHSPDSAIVDVQNARALSSVVIVCEHASPYIPAEFQNLGLADGQLNSHVVWDPGALALAKRISTRLDAALVASKISRLVYDCNRPPGAPDAMPARSEVVDVPGNEGLTAEQRSDRVATYYEPFRLAVSQVMAAVAKPVLITVHSFTPIYHGQVRDVEIGVLHDSDTRLADALLSVEMPPHKVRRNDPYGPTDGVTHTLQEHALPGGHLNVMLEVRNDLIETDAALDAMSDTLASWIERALAKAEAAA